MNIQIDNLCQFLPQDRVVEFAGLGPVPLLRETQRAAAPPEVLQDHEHLKDMRLQERKLKIKVEADKERLATAQHKQKLLERDVERLRERQSVQENIKMLNWMMIFVQYQDSRANREKAKHEYKQRKYELKLLKDEQQPQLEEISESENLETQLLKWLVQERMKLQVLEQDIKQFRGDVLEKLQEKEKKTSSDLKLIFDNEQRRMVCLLPSPRSNRNKEKDAWE